MLLANNIMLIGFHILTGAKILNTLSDHSQCTIVFNVGFITRRGISKTPANPDITAQVIILLLGILFSLPRTLRHVSFMSMGSGRVETSHAHCMQRTTDIV